MLTPAEEIEWNPFWTLTPSEMAEAYARIPVYQECLRDAGQRNNLLAILNSGMATAMQCILACERLGPQAPHSADRYGNGWTKSQYWYLERKAVATDARAMIMLAMSFLAPNEFGEVVDTNTKQRFDLWTVMMEAERAVDDLQNVALEMRNPGPVGPLQ